MHRHEAALQHFQPKVNPDCFLGHRAAPARSQKTLADFWHPRRRLTDLLLILNVGAFGLQYYSKGALLNWGVKVLFCRPGGTSDWQPSCAAGARISTSGQSGHVTDTPQGFACR